MKLNLPPNVTHTLHFLSIELRQKTNRTRDELAGSQTQNAASALKTQPGVGVGLVALLSVPLNPVRCVFMLGLTRRSGERCDSLSGFRHIVAAK